MSDDAPTPETDADSKIPTGAMAESFVVPADFARKLERDRNALKKSLLAARHALGADYGIGERAVAEGVALLVSDYLKEKHHVTKLIIEGAELKADRDALNTGENRIAIGLGSSKAADEEILNLHRCFDGLKARYHNVIAERDKLREALKLIREDYNHPWPNEDEGTRDHRTSTFNKITALIQ